VPPGWNEWYGMKNVAYYNYKIVENGVEVSYGSAPADYSTDVLREKARGFITNAVGMGQPFFLYFAPKAPHGPFTPAPASSANVEARSMLRAKQPSFRGSGASGG